MAFISSPFIHPPTHSSLASIPTKTTLPKIINYLHLRWHRFSEEFQNADPLLSPACMTLPFNLRSHPFPASAPESPPTSLYMLNFLQFLVTGPFLPPPYTSDCTPWCLKREAGNGIQPGKDLQWRKTLPSERETQPQVIMDLQECNGNVAS